MAVPRYPPRVTSRAVLRTAVMATVAGVPAAPAVRAAAVIAPQGSMVVAWHTTIAPRWHERQQQHDGSATPNGLLTARQNTLIKNHKNRAYHCTAVHGSL
jgi:hypothetical protein